MLHFPFGFCQESEDPCRVIPNAVVRSKGDRKTYFGHEIAKCKDYSSLHYRLPFEKVCYLITYRQRLPDSSRKLRVISLTGMLRRPFGTVSSRMKCFR